MALDKKHYEEQGARAARRDHTADGENSDSPHKNGTWQAKAWQEGYDIEWKRLGPVQAQEGPRTQWAPVVAEASAHHATSIKVGHDLPKQRGPHYREDISGLREINVLDLMSLAQAIVMPRGARQHLLHLSAEHNEEHDLKRRARLHRAVGRVYCRWVERTPGVLSDEELVSVPMLKAAGAVA